MFGLAARAVCALAASASGATAAVVIALRRVMDELDNVVSPDLNLFAHDCIARGPTKAGALLFACLTLRTTRDTAEFSARTSRPAAFRSKIRRCARTMPLRRPCNRRARATRSR